MLSEMKRLGKNVKGESVSQLAQNNEYAETTGTLAFHVLPSGAFTSYPSGNVDCSLHSRLSQLQLLTDSLSQLRAAFIP
jgi:hypothetical protein